MKDFYIVQPHDTLYKIAKQYGTSIDELRKLNDLRDPNKLHPGQKIALHKKAVCGFEALFLDADRNPIKGLEYVLEFCGKSARSVTAENGKSRKIITDSPLDEVRILVKRFDDTLKEVANVASGYRNKLCTLISPLIVVETELKPHPKLKQGERVNSRDPIKPEYGDHHPATPTTEKKDLGPKARKSSTAEGKPVTVVEGDIPLLDEFLAPYVGGEVTKTDIEAAAIELGCDPGLIYAIAKQESSSSSFIQLGNRTVPKILYERHQFRNRTRSGHGAVSPYEGRYPDVCGPAYMRATKNRKGEWIELKSGAPVSQDDVYGPSGSYQYKRLCKAYQLDSSAALESCSWGKFQIMGFNYRKAGFSDVRSFTKTISRSDVEHLKIFLKFAKSNEALMAGLKEKNFEKIARGHNGKEWRRINPEYASNIKQYCNEYASKY